jgi:hypothetical protein
MKSLKYKPPHCRKGDAGVGSQVILAVLRYVAQ